PCSCSSGTRSKEEKLPRLPRCSGMLLTSTAVRKQENRPSATNVIAVLATLTTASSLTILRGYSLSFYLIRGPNKFRSIPITFAQQTRLLDLYRSAAEWDKPVGHVACRPFL